LDGFGSDFGGAFRILWARLWSFCIEMSLAWGLLRRGSIYSHRAPICAAFCWRLLLGVLGFALVLVAVLVVWWWIGLLQGVDTRLFVSAVFGMFLAGDGV
jgi:hypothetical protein